MCTQCGECENKGSYSILLSPNLCPLSQDIPVQIRWLAVPAKIGGFGPHFSNVYGHVRVCSHDLFCAHFARPKRVQLWADYSSLH